MNILLSAVRNALIVKGVTADSVMRLTLQEADDILNGPELPRHTTTGGPVPLVITRGVDTSPSLEDRVASARKRLMDLVSSKDNHQQASSVSSSPSTSRETSEAVMWLTPLALKCVTAQPSAASEIVRRCPLYSIDPALALNIASYESKLQMVANVHGAKGIFQLTPIAIKDLHNRYGLEGDYDYRNLEQSVDWGLRYLKTCFSYAGLQSNSRYLSLDELARVTAYVYAVFNLGIGACREAFVFSPNGVYLGMRPTPSGSYPLAEKSLKTQARELRVGGLPNYISTLYKVFRV